jgi:hypothetical protein
MSINWKSLLTILIAIAGVAVPIWLWQIDLQSRSLTVTLISQVPLEPKEKDAIGGIEVLVAGQKLQTPQLVLFEIRNTGLRPIQSAEFDGPLEIRVDGGAEFARAKITRQYPTGLEMEATTERQKIAVKPALLNPDDWIQISAITTGIEPKFSSKVRVAGVSTTPIQTVAAGKAKPSKLIVISVMTMGFMLMVVSIMFVERVANNGPSVELRRRAAIFSFFTTLSAAVFPVIAALEMLDVMNTLYQMMALFGLSVPAAFLAGLLNRDVMRPANEKTSNGRRSPGARDPRSSTQSRSTNN